MPAHLGERVPVDVRHFHLQQDLAVDCHGGLHDLVDRFSLVLELPSALLRKAVHRHLRSGKPPLLLLPLHGQPGPRERLLLRHHNPAVHVPKLRVGVGIQGVLQKTPTQVHQKIKPVNIANYPPSKKKSP